MARIIVKTNDGRHTVLDERNVDVSILTEAYRENSIEMLDRLEAAIRDADRRLRAPRGRSVPKRIPARRAHTLVPPG